MVKVAADSEAVPFGGNMRRDRIKTGVQVTTETTSGEQIVCTVMYAEDGEYVLSSPAHGYAIRRGYREIQPYAQAADQ
jgi:hypothetical protein